MLPSLEISKFGIIVLSACFHSHKRVRPPVVNSSIRSPATASSPRARNRMRRGSLGYMRSLLGCRSQVHAVPHCHQIAMTHVQGPDDQWFDAEVALRPAAALRHGIAEPGRNIAFFFQAIERAIQRTDGDGSAGAIFDFAPQGNAVGILPESEDGEECDLLEFAQMLARRHMFCTIGQYESGVNPVPGLS